MSKNKLTKFEEIKTFEHVVQVPYNFIKNNDYHLKGMWAQRFFNNDNPIVLELGCGKGEYTLGLAERFPGKNFMGVDIKGARLWNGAQKSLQKKLENVGFLRTHIEMIHQFFGPEEIEEIWLTFPDPQMKKIRKRLTSTFFLDKYRTFLKKQGTIHLKTDSFFQYTYTLDLVRQNQFKILALTENLYQSEFQDDALQIKTFYEEQWLKRGIAIKYLSFKLNDAVLTEPEKEPEKDLYRSFGRSKRK